MENTVIDGDILKKVAPCSLICYTCLAYRDGVICNSSKTLLKHLQGVKEFYSRHVPDAVKNYSNFEETLCKCSNASCSGCRSAEHNHCSIKGCFIFECTKRRGINFCGECDNFPCQGVKELFEEEVYKQWLEGNQQIRDYGIEIFWISNSEKGHYVPYVREGDTT